MKIRKKSKDISASSIVQSLIPKNFLDKSKTKNKPNSITKAASNQSDFSSASQTKPLSLSEQTRNTVMKQHEIKKTISPIEATAPKDLSYVIPSYTIQGGEEFQNHVIQAATRHISLEDRHDINFTQSNDILHLRSFSSNSPEKIQLKTLERTSQENNCASSNRSNKTSAEYAVDAKIDRESYQFETLGSEHQRSYVLQVHKNSLITNSPQIHPNECLGSAVETPLLASIIENDQVTLKPTKKELTLKDKNTKNFSVLSDSEASSTKFKTSNSNEQNIILGKTRKDRSKSAYKASDRTYQINDNVKLVPGTESSKCRLLSSLKQSSKRINNSLIFSKAVYSHEKQYSEPTPISSNKNDYRVDFLASNTEIADRVRASSTSVAKSKYHQTSPSNDSGDVLILKEPSPQKVGKKTIPPSMNNNNSNIRKRLILNTNSSKSNSPVFGGSSTSANQKIKLPNSKHEKLVSYGSNTVINGFKPIADQSHSKKPLMLETSYANYEATNQIEQSKVTQDSLLVSSFDSKATDSIVGSPSKDPPLYKSISDIKSTRNRVMSPRRERAGGRAVYINASPGFPKLERKRSKGKRRSSTIKKPKSLELGKDKGNVSKSCRKNTEPNLKLDSSKLCSMATKSLKDTISEPKSVFLGTPSTYFEFLQDETDSEAEGIGPTSTKHTQLKNASPTPPSPPYQEALDRRDFEMKAWKSEHGDLKSWKYSVTLKVPHDDQAADLFFNPAFNGKYGKDKSPGGKSGWSTGIFEKFSKTRSRSLIPPDSPKEDSYDMLTIPRGNIPSKFKSIFSNDANIGELVSSGDKKKIINLKRVFFSTSENKPKDHQSNSNTVLDDTRKNVLAEEIQCKPYKNIQRNSFPLNDQLTNPSKVKKIENSYSSENRTVYLNLKKALDYDLKSPLKSAPPFKTMNIFGMPLNKAVSYSMLVSKVPLPAVVIRCIEYLEKYGLKEIGLYRVSGSTKSVSAIRTLFASGYDINLEEITCDIHNVSTLLKAYLRELPEPLTTDRLKDDFEHLNNIYFNCCKVNVDKNSTIRNAKSYSEIFLDGAKDSEKFQHDDRNAIESQSIDSMFDSVFLNKQKVGHGSTTNSSTLVFDGVYKDKKEWLKSLSQLLRQLPECNFELLKWLSLHLARVAHFSDYNKMTLSNLSIIFCTTLRIGGHIFSEMILNSEFIFLDRRNTGDNNKVIASSSIPKPGSKRQDNDYLGTISSFKKFPQSIDGDKSPSILEGTKARRSSENTLLKSEDSNDTKYSDIEDVNSNGTLYGLDIFQSAEERDAFVAWISIGKLEWINVIRSGRTDQLLSKSKFKNGTNIMSKNNNTRPLNEANQNSLEFKHYDSKKPSKNVGSSSLQKQIPLESPVSRFSFSLINMDSIEFSSNEMDDPHSISSSRNHTKEFTGSNVSVKDKVLVWKTSSPNISRALKTYRSSLELSSNNFKPGKRSDIDANIRDNSLQALNNQTYDFYKDQPKSSIPIIKTTSNPSAIKRNETDIYHSAEVHQNLKPSKDKTVLTPNRNKHLPKIQKPIYSELEFHSSPGVSHSSISPTQGTRGMSNQNTTPKNNMKLNKETHLNLYALEDSNYFKDIQFETDDHFLKSPILNPSASYSSLKSKLNLEFAKSEIFGETNDSFEAEKAEIASKNFKSLAISEIGNSFDPFASSRNPSSVNHSTRSKTPFLPESPRYPLSGFFVSRASINSHKNTLSESGLKTSTKFSKI